MEKEFTAYGQEWKKQMKSMNKDMIIEIAAGIGKQLEQSKSEQLSECCSAEVKHTVCDNVLLPDVFVYVVACSSGSWDSFHWWIGGIFNEPKDAEELKDKLNAEAKRIKDECPVKGNKDDMSEEDEDKYWTYFSSKENAMEWNDATVKEYPVNKPCR